MKRRALPLWVAILALAGTASVCRGGSPNPTASADAGRLPRIRPDYAGITMPPNIAPLNFVVCEQGKRYLVRLSGGQGHEFRVSSSNGQVRLPAGRWRALLAASRGGEILMEVSVQDAQGGWRRFAPIRNRVAAEEIDSHLVYRRLGPLYNQWTTMGIYQRNLETWDERPVLKNTAIGNQCVNCHTFANNRPHMFLLQTRPAGSGQPTMVLVRGTQVTRVDTRTPEEKRAATYVSWHPSEELIAFSFNKIRQFFHTAGSEPREVIDLAAGIGVYHVKSGAVSRPAPLNPKGRLGTFPAWSPDGRWLYYCSAPALWSNTNVIPHAQASRVRYDLVRAPFDPATQRWGSPETVVAAAHLGKSLLEPRVSPDGRFLLFTACAYGSFPIFQQQSDLYLVDLRTRPFRPQRLQPGTDSYRDSWHSWSSNSRWIVFSRKRDNGAFSRPYVCYLDANGRAAKAFVVPQEDPIFYDRCLQNYNAPELATGPVTVAPRALAQALRAVPITPAAEAASKW
ncbi:MAG: hypothetical protein QHJ73_06280 [Armatimonadota bacterium]|nr:hypothetical protein [Armatimonadota bacterium]